MDTPRISVVIPTYRASELALRAAQALDPVPSWAELIVVDDGSGDDTVEIIGRALPSVRVVALERNRGFGGAVNAGFLHAAGRFLATLNNDALADWAGFEALLDALEDRPRAGAVAPAILDDRERPARVAFRFPLAPWGRVARALRRSGSSDAVVTAPAPGQEAFRCDYVKGVCVVFRRDALADTGLFDEQFWMFAEEIDLFRRLDRLGWETWVEPDAVVRHAGGSTTRNHPDRAESSRYRQRSYRSLSIYAGKHHAWPAAMAMRAELAARVLGRALRETARVLVGRGEAWWVVEHLRCLATLARPARNRPRVPRLPRRPW